MLLDGGGLCLKPGYEVDHIVEMADGGSFHEWLNLRTLCEGCHLAKTNAMRAKRAEKKKAEKHANKVLSSIGQIDD
jgi:5-methylcytosine-specific restriction endonuclease McrA